MTTLCISSMPADVDATDENRSNRRRTSSSPISPSISPSATATPSADAPREYAIEPYALFVTVLFPRANAASMRSLVKSGHLICTKWTSCWIDDSRISHGGRDRLCRFLDLRAASDLLGQKIAGVRHPDAEAFSGNAFGLAIGDVVTREDGDMRTKHTFRTAGHHERDPLFDAVRRQIEIRRQRSA